MPEPTPYAGRQKEARRDPPLPTPRRAWEQGGYSFILDIQAYF